MEAELAVVMAKLDNTQEQHIDNKGRSVKSLSSSSFGSSTQDDPNDEYTLLQQVQWCKWLLERSEWSCAVQEILKDLNNDGEELPQRVSADLERVSVEFGSNKGLLVAKCLASPESNRTYDGPPTLKQTENLLREATDVLDKDVLEVSDDDQPLECDDFRNSGIGDFLKEAERLGIDPHNASSIQLGSMQLPRDFR